MVCISETYDMNIANFTRNHLVPIRDMPNSRVFTNFGTSVFQLKPNTDISPLLIGNCFAACYSKFDISIPLNIQVNY